jgi:hypothetical protein
VLPKIKSLAGFQLLFTMITLSSWAAGATPDASEPRSPTGLAAGETSTFVVQLGGIAAPGLGANAAADARLTHGLHLGVQAGYFSDHRNAYPFVGARASYRIAVNRWLRVVPTFGIARVSVLAMDEDPFRVVYQSPVSPTVGLQLVAQIGHFITGLDAQLMPVHTTKSTPEAFGAETSNETLLPFPVALFAGATF